MGILEETSSLVRTVLPWLKKLFNFRTRLESKIEIDVVADSDAILINLGNIPHAINVSLRVSNFSPIFSVKIEKLTGSITINYRQIIFKESILVSEKAPAGQSTHVYCKFKLSDSQVRLLREFSNCCDLEARISIEAEMSSRWGTICKWMPDKAILVKSWSQPADI